MISAFRLCKTKFISTAFSGEGARLNGGRWNSPGQSMVYTSSSLSLATLEVLVHLEDTECLARLFSWVRLKIPEDSIQQTDELRLPKGWCADETNVSSRGIGDAWIRSMRTAVLAVPSVVTPSEWNYLLNPAHPDFSRIRIGESKPFRPDPRLIS